MYAAIDRRARDFIGWFALDARLAGRPHEPELGYRIVRVGLGSRTGHRRVGRHDRPGLPRARRRSGLGPDHGRQRRVAPGAGEGGTTPRPKLPCRVAGADSRATSRAMSSTRSPAPNGQLAASGCIRKSMGSGTQGIRSPPSLKEISCAPAYSPWSEQEPWPGPLWPVPPNAAEKAQLSVLHAVPGLTVDVYVNGERTINNFKPGNPGRSAESRRRHLRGRDHRRRRRRRLRSGHRPDRSGAGRRRELHRRRPSQGGRRPHGDPVHQRHLQDRRRSGPAHRPAHRRGTGGRHPRRRGRGDQRPREPGREGSRS